MVMSVVTLSFALVGLKLVIVGVVLITVNESVDVISSPSTETFNCPDVKPAGMITDKEVFVAEKTVSVTPLSVTIFSAGTELKLVPVIITFVSKSSTALAGEKLVMVGKAFSIVKDSLDSAAFPLTSTLIFPVEPPAGSVARRAVLVAVATVKANPFRVTMFSEGVGLKLTPTMLIVVISLELALKGSMPVMTGAPSIRLH